MGGSSSYESAPEDVKNIVDKYFSQFDMNRDGYITMKEMLTYHERDWGNDFEAKRAEIMESVKEDFFTWDSNNDQKVTKDEMANFWKEHRDLIQYVKF